MTTALVAVLPVSGVNLGLQASLGGLTIEATKLQADFVNVFPSLEAQLKVTANFPPSIASYAGPIAARLNPLELAAAFTGMPTIGADVNADASLKLGFLVGQIEALEALAATLGAGLASGGIAGWTYTGRESGFGKALEPATRNGFGTFAPGDQVTATIIVTETRASWQALSEGVDTGDAADEQASSSAEVLRFLGQRGGGSWNTGTADLLARFDVLLAELRGQKAALEAQIQLSLGVGLPSPGVVVDAGLEIFGELGITAILDNLVNVQTDVTGMLGTYQARIDASVDLAADVSAQLSAGGLGVWTYTGAARALGAEVRAALVEGVPGGAGPKAAVYGLVLAGSLPSMAAFGSVFLTAA